jgi:hypothetical protein
MIGAILAKRGVAGSYDAMNRHDLPEVMAGWRGDAVFTYPGDISASGTFEGRGAIEAWFRLCWPRIHPFAHPSLRTDNPLGLLGLTSKSLSGWHFSARTVLPA